MEVSPYGESIIRFTLASFIFFIPLIVFGGNCHDAGATKTIEEILSTLSVYSDLKRATGYKEWFRKYFANPPPKNAFGISIGFYDFDLTRVPNSIRKTLDFDDQDAVLIRTFEISGSDTIDILPPLVWHNVFDSLLGYDLRPKTDPIFFALEMDLLVLGRANKMKYAGPLFYVFLDDFHGHSIFENKALNSSFLDFNSNERLAVTEHWPEVEPETPELGFSQLYLDLLAQQRRTVRGFARQVDILEGFTEGEIRILLKEPAFLRRTIFFQAGRPLSASEAKPLLGKMLQYCDFYNDYNPPITKRIE